VFGAEPGYQLGDFIVGERVAERGHLAAAVQDLAGNGRRFHGFANLLQIRTLGGALGLSSVAVGAALVAEEVGPGLFGLPGIRGGPGDNG